MRDNLNGIDTKVNKSSEELTDAIGKVVKEFQDQLFSQHKYVGKELEESRAYILSMVESKLADVEYSGVRREHLGQMMSDIGRQLSEAPSFQDSLGQSENPEPEAKDEGLSEMSEDGELEVARNGAGLPEG